MNDDSSDSSDGKYVNISGLPTPHSNTGVTGSPQGENFRYSLDWLRYSVSYDVPVPECVPDGELYQPSGDVLTPARMYNQVVGLMHGRIDWNTERPEQKRLVTFTGSNLAGLLAGGENIPRLLGYALALKGANVTRLDFAVDVRNRGADALDLKAAFEAGRGLTDALTGQIVEGRNRKGEQKGVTYYIGSRESERFMRVYDKAAQMGLDDDWTRIELELKGGQARAAAFAMATEGIVATGKHLLRAFYQDTGVPWYDAAIEGDEGVYVEPVGRPVSKREKWLLEQVVPALLTELRKGNQRVRWSFQKALDDTEQFIGHGPAVE